MGANLEKGPIFFQQQIGIPRLIYEYLVCTISFILYILEKTVYIHYIHLCMCLIYTNILWMYPRPTNSDSLRRDPNWLVKRRFPKRRSWKHSAPRCWNSCDSWVMNQKKYCTRGLKYVARLAYITLYGTRGYMRLCHLLNPLWQSFLRYITAQKWSANSWGLPQSEITMKPIVWPSNFLQCPHHGA